MNEKLKEGDIINGWEILELDSGYIDNEGHKLTRFLCISCGIGEKLMYPTYLKRSKYRCEVCEQLELNSLIGQKFGRLTILSLIPTEKSPYMYYCKCDCGNTISVSKSHLTTGNVKSCGCYKQDVINEKYKTYGLSNHRLYGILYNIKRRCYDPRREDYSIYGAVGIYVCDEWLDKEYGFINFYNWAINNGYDDNLTIERIDVYGPYAPYNCKWITNGEQQRNKRNTLYTYFEDGTRISIIELSEKLNLKYDSLKYYNSIGKLNEYLIKNNITDLKIKEKGEDSFED